jgi:hypothetical protein
MEEINSIALAAYTRQRVGGRSGYILMYSTCRIASSVYIIHEGSMGPVVPISALY